MDGYFIYDDVHCDMHGRFVTFEEALTELKTRANIPWNEEPNRAPCTSWRTCSRDYSIAKMDYDYHTKMWKQVERTSIVDISSSGVVWHIKVD